MRLAVGVDDNLPRGRGVRVRETGAEGSSGYCYAATVG